MSHLEENLNRFDHLTPLEIYQLVDSEDETIQDLENAGFLKLNNQELTDNEISDTFEKLTSLRAYYSVKYETMYFYQHLLQTGAVEKNPDGTYRFGHLTGTYWPKKIAEFQKISSSIPRTAKGLEKAKKTSEIQESIDDLFRHFRYLQDTWLGLRTYWDLEEEDENAICTYYKGLVCTLAEKTSNLCLVRISSFNEFDPDSETDVTDITCFLFLAYGLTVSDCYQLLSNAVLSEERLLFIGAASLALFDELDKSWPLKVQSENKFDLLEKAFLLCRGDDSFSQILISMDDFLKSKGAIDLDNSAHGVKHALGTTDRIVKKALDQTKDFFVSKQTPEVFQRNAKINLSEVCEILDSYQPIYHYITQTILEEVEESEENPLLYVKNYFGSFSVFVLCFLSYLCKLGIPLPDGKQLSSPKVPSYEVVTATLQTYQKNGMSPTVKQSVSTAAKKETVRRKKSFRWLIPVLLILFVAVGWKIYPMLTEDRLTVKKNTEDYQFLMELQDTVLESMELAEDPNATHEDIFAAEQHLFALYETTEFETAEIETIAGQYIQGLRMQEESLSLIYVKAQLKWQEGVTTRFRALMELKEEYGFGKELKKSGIDIEETLKQEEFQLEALQTLETEIREKVKNLNYRVEGNKLSGNLPNDTKYEFNLHLCFKYYDENDNVFEEGHTEIHVLNRSYPSFEVDCPDSWSRVRVYWEIDLLSEP